MEKKRMTNPERLGVGSGLKTAMTVLAVLGIAAVVTMFGPSGKTVNAESESKAAKPAPTPLRADAAAALLQQLKDSLVDNLEEDAINAIQEKWDRQILTGKTREQILKLLFDQLKTVVEDEETQNTIWESWQSIGAEEPPTEEPPGPTEPKTPPNSPVMPLPEYEAPVLTGRRSARSGSPEVGISDETKRLEGLKEELTFQGMINQIPRWSQAQNLSYRRQTYTIYRDLDDPEGQIKFDGVQKGIALLVDNGVVLPFGLTFYLARDIGALGPTAAYCKKPDGSMASVPLPDGKTWPKCMALPKAQAFKRTDNWRPVARVIISSLQDTDGAMSKRGLMGLPKVPVTTIHEVSHILHERVGGEFFWTIPAAHKTAAEVETAMQVGNYAVKGPKEFIAEVFTGNMLGLKFSPQVITEYQRWRGPRLTK